jgi:hypothetical protein
MGSNKQRWAMGGKKAVDRGQQWTSMISNAQQWEAAHMDSKNGQQWAEMASSGEWTSGQDSTPQQ